MISVYITVQHVSEKQTQKVTYSCIVYNINSQLYDCLSEFDLLNVINLHVNLLILKPEASSNKQNKHSARRLFLLYSLK